MLSLILLLTTFKNFRTSFYYLYRSTGSLIANAAAHENCDDIFIFSEVIQVTPAMVEVSNYNSVTFVPYWDMSGIEELEVDTGKGLVVTVGEGCDFEVISELVQQKWPEMNAYDYLGKHSYTTSYYFFSKKS